MEKLKIGVVGTGHLGTLHTKMFSQIETCELVGVYDIDYKLADSVAKEYGTKAFRELDELLEAVEAVSVAVITTNHNQVAKYCLNKGKHVFVEKPIASTIDEAKELVSIAKDKKLNLQVGHVERFNPALVSLEKYDIHPLFIQTDRLAQFNPRGTDVAVVLDLMIHDIDIILSLVKSPVRKIDASGVAVVSDTIDIANARIEFENGAVANVTASRISQKKMRKMRMFQKDTYISLDFTDGVSEVFKLYPADEKIDSAHINYGEMGVGEKKKKVVYEQPEVIEINALKYELELFVKSVQKKERPVVSGEDGLNALIVADTIIKIINSAHMEEKLV